jgi:surfactin synthase thioesterase subunit
MHPELRRARALYHEWRSLPDRERKRLAPFAREVKELALDLRGHVDGAGAERELALANETLGAFLAYSGWRAA